MTTCQICGKEVDQTGSRHPRQYCSDKCRRLAVRAYNSEYQRKRRAAMSDEQKADLAYANHLIYEKKAWALWTHEAGALLDLISKAPSDKLDIVLARYMASHYKPSNPSGLQVSFKTLPEAVEATELLNSIDIK